MSEETIINSETTMVEEDNVGEEGMTKTTQEDGSKGEKTQPAKTTVQKNTRMEILGEKKTKRRKNKKRMKRKTKAARQKYKHKGVSNSARPQR